MIEPNQLIARARDLVPFISSQAPKMEEERRLSDEVIKAVSEAGLLRMRVPSQYGGYESDLRTVQAVTAELATADISTAWVVAIYACAAGLVAKFPDAAQREAFTSPDAKIGVVLSPTGTATPVSGGLRVNGKWSFVSGAWDSDWVQLVATRSGPDGPDRVAILVPLSDLTRVDDWQTVGLRASGSITVIADDIVVPDHRWVQLAPMMQPGYASEQNAGKPAYRPPAVAVSVITFSGPLIGGAQAAFDAFAEHLPGRGIAFTAYGDQSAAPVTHRQLGKAALLLDEARFHAERAAGMADAKAGDDEAWSVGERVRVRADAGRATELAQRAVKVLGSASGASSIRADVPIRRVISDVEALSLHGLLLPSSATELYGRVLAGLEPNSAFL